jgi:glycosyltransferase involved in cell wall biosynthesis
VVSHIEIEMPGTDRSLRILHVLRLPLGGLFRHVMDVARGQIERGHAVGIICDAATGGDYVTRVLDNAAPKLALGLSRFAMPRQLGFADLAATRHVAGRVAQSVPDVVHGHGAKGAAYVRLAVGRGGPLRVYTPHGGSLHYRPGTPGAAFYMLLERLLKPRTDLFLFESSFIARLFEAKVGIPDAPVRVVPNGLAPAEFAEVPMRADATDLLYIGELRRLKGVDLLIDALASLRDNGMPLTATIVGDGRNREELKQQVRQRGLDPAIRFFRPMPAREAFALGRLMVVPSRSESFPYIVLEAAAAAKPLVVTRVGGIPEMFGPLADRLVTPDDARALEAAIANSVNQSERTMADVRLLQERIRTTFSLDDMVDGGLRAYREAMAARKS